MVVIHLREVLVDFSGFEMSLYPVLNRMKANIMYLKTLQSRIPNCQEHRQFYWWKLSIWCMIHTLVYEYLQLKKSGRIDMKSNSLTFSSPFLYDLIITVSLVDTEAWSVSVWFKISFFPTCTCSKPGFCWYSLCMFVHRSIHPYKNRSQIWPHRFWVILWQNLVRMASRIHRAIQILSVWNRLLNQILRTDMLIYATTYMIHCYC